MFDYIKKSKKLLFIILLGFLFLMITIIPSGSYYCFQKQCGIFFWGTNGHDGVWHLALISTAFKQLPFISPIYANLKLSGYNFLMDFVLYLFSFLHLSPSFMYFKFLPIIWFIFFTAAVIVLGRKIINSSSYVFWLFFFMFFGSSFTFVFPLYHNGSIWGASSLLSMQSGQVLTNMQFALSLIVLLNLFIVLKSKKLTIKSHLIIGLLLFINFGLKFYAGFVSVVTVGVFYIFQHFVSKDRFKIDKILKTFFYLGLVFLFVVSAIIIFYDPFNSLKTGSIFVFSPFSTMHSVIEEPVLFYMKDMVNARYFLYEHGIGPRLIFIEAFSSALFLFFSLGLRIFGVAYILYKIMKKKISTFDISVTAAATAAYVFLLFFVQKGEWWNVIQFYYYTLFILNIYTAGFFYEIIHHIKKRSIQILIISAVIILSIPGNLDILKNFASWPAQSYLPKEEIQALSFLKKQPKGSVYAQSLDKKKIKMEGMKPLYIAEDSAYVSAFSSHPTYLNDYQVLNITGTDYQTRLKKVQNHECAILKEIDYIYFVKKDPDIWILNCLNNNEYDGKKIFENSSVVIYLTQYKNQMRYSP